MSYIFETVTGNASALAFNFNGQVSIKNYDVEIVNGNRLKVVSTQNEMFSLLEADVSEVEINGIVYSDPLAAQFALKALVSSTNEPVVMTKEMFMQLSAAIQAADRGKIMPDTPVPSGGWQPGWYHPGKFENEDPGTNYPNQNNLKAKKGFITKFLYNGVTWDEIAYPIPKASNNIRIWENLTAADFPLSEGSQVIHDGAYWMVKNGQVATISDTPSEDQSNIWQQIGEKSSFETLKNETSSTLGYFSNGEVIPDPSHICYSIDNSDGQITKLILNGNKIDSALPQAYIAGVKWDDSWVEISPANGGTDNNVIYTNSFVAYRIIYVTFYKGSITSPTAKTVKTVSLESLYSQFNFVASKIVPRLSKNNTVKANSDILQGAIYEAWASNKSIEFPHGEFAVKNVKFLPVNASGNDRNTIFKSVDASPIFIGHENMPYDITGLAQLPNPIGNKYTGCEFGGFTLWGNNVGTYGMDLLAMAYAKMNRIVCYGFTEAAIRTKGMLVCDWYDLNIRKCKNGIIADEGTFQGNLWTANLVTYRGLRINETTGKAIDWSHGTGLTLYDFDAEECGTTGNADTGIIHIHSVPQNPPQNNFIGLRLTNSWGERNRGGFFLKIDGPLLCSVENTDLQNAGTATGCLINNGGKLLIHNCYTEAFPNGTVQTNGANAQTLVTGLSTVGNHVEANGGVYRDNTMLSGENFITQSQYDSLTTAQKNNGTKYFIS